MVLLKEFEYMFSRIVRGWCVCNFFVLFLLILWQHLVVLFLNWHFDCIIVRWWWVDFDYYKLCYKTEPIKIKLPSPPITILTSGVGGTAIRAAMCRCRAICRRRVTNIMVIISFFQLSPLNGDSNTYWTKGQSLSWNQDKRECSGVGNGQSWGLFHPRYNRTVHHGFGIQCSWSSTDQGLILALDRVL